MNLKCITVGIGAQLIENCSLALSEKSVAGMDGEDSPSNPSQNPILNTVLEARLTRRDVTQGFIDLTAFVAIQHRGDSDDPHVLATFETSASRWPDFTEAYHRDRPLLL